MPSIEFLEDEENPELNIQNDDIVDLVLEIDDNDSPVNWGEIGGYLLDQVDLINFITSYAYKWGNITGSLTDQLDLVNYINQHSGKINKLTKNGVELYMTPSGLVDIPVPVYVSELINNAGYLDRLGVSQVIVTFLKSLRGYSATGTKTLKLVDGEFIWE